MNSKKYKFFINYPGLDKSLNQRRARPAINKTLFIACIGKRARQLTSFWLLFCMLLISVPAAPPILAGEASSFKQNLLIGISLNNFLQSLRETVFGGNPATQRVQQQTQEERDARIARVEIEPQQASVAIGANVYLSAIPYDRNDVPVSGVRFDWEYRNGENARVPIADGLFKPETAGEYEIIARAVGGSGFEASAKIKVTSKPDISLVKQNEAQNLPLPFEEWDVNNIEYARSNPRNDRGTTPGKPKENSNYNISAPVLALSGRGIGLDLSLTYNSRVWSKLGQDVSYDMDKDWLAPGWNLGFGKIINMVGGGIVQVEGDGTRRYYSGDATTYPDRVDFEGQSNDGTFIKSKTVTSGYQVNGTACYYNPFTYLKYPNGTTIEYGALEIDRPCFNLNEPITMVPKRVTDRNGNRLEINYHLPSSSTSPGRWISTIKDTLGRIYSFNYTLTDGRYLLTSISGPGLRDENGNVVPRTFVRLGYKNHTITHNFNGLTPHVRENTVKVLSAVYYPENNSGYWFGDSDSYSPYGMIRIIREQKGMSYDDVNGIAAGQTLRQRTYAYPSSTAAALDDIPAFGTVTETWEGITTSDPVTTYSINWDSTPRTTTITAPDGSQVIEYSFNKSSLPNTDPEKYKDGITFKTDYKDSNNQLRARDEVEWEPGHLNIPRPKKITHSEFENNITLTKIIANDVFGEYNQVLESSEYGYGGTSDLLRKTVTEYIKKNDSPANDNEWRALPRLINLPSLKEVFSDNKVTRIAYAKYEYDIHPIQALNGANPTNFCSDSYCNSVTQRGNLTRIKTYENAADITTGEISDSRVYDKTGNLVSYLPEVSATNENTYKYTAQTAYAFPEEFVTGDTSSPNAANLQIKSTSVFDINTGLTLSTVSPNQQPIQYVHNLQTWRPTRMNLPTGAYSNYDYNDSTLSYTVTEYDNNNTVKTKRINRQNGLGLTYRSETLAGVENNQEIWDVVETIFDEFGRTKKTSNPFRSNQSQHGVYWTEAFYDKAGRVWKTVGPDNSTKYTYYNQSARPQGASAEFGNTFLTVDSLGREKWYRTDADGNVAEVVEPNPDGNGTVAANGYLTKYSYDRLRQLTQTEQGAQIRKFKYDQLGRLTHQKMAETKATLNNAGTFVGEASGLWSEFYTYDKVSNITSYTDARGVKTSYSYVNPAYPQLPADPLNRLFSISYNTNGATDVLPSPTVNLSYLTSGNFTQLKSIDVAGVSTTEFDYDLRGRIKEKKTTLTSRTAFPLTTNYFYDSLNRVTDITYPAQHGTTGSPRKNVHYDFDIAGRMNNLKVDNVDYASNFVFNAYSQVDSVKIGPAGGNQITETYNYYLQTGLLQNQKVLRGTTGLLDLSYEYHQCSCAGGGSGQVKQITNNLDRNKDRKYDYDKLGRLQKVTGGINQGWSQTYVYDRYGNRTNVNSLGFESMQGADTEAESKNEQQKILNQAFTAAPTKARDLLPNIKELAKMQPETGKISESSNAGFRQIEDAEASNPTNRQPAANEKQNSPPMSMMMPPNRTPFDFDYDGRADFAVWQKSGGNWVVNQSGDNQNVTEQFGANGNQIAPGDYDGDGKTDKAIWNTSTGYWWIRNSSNGNVVTTQWGQTGDSIVPADYDGDGKTDLAVFRPSDGVWYILHSSNNNWSANPFGNQTFGDIPVPGDYDGDGKADVAVWRPSTGYWYIYQSSNGQVASPQFGANGDVPVPAKYDGDNKTDLAVWRPNGGQWYILPSTTGNYTVTQWGAEIHRDVLVPADYDGDGKADIAVWRSTTGYWYVIRSSDGGLTAYQQGTRGNIPIPSAYIRRSSAPKNQSQEIPRDGMASVTYDESSNRVTNANFTYDAAGNQTQVQREDGKIIRFKYDAANRLTKVIDNTNNLNQTLVTYTYGESRERLIAQEGDETSTNRIYYVWESGAVISEYTDSASSSLVWAKNYIYLGSALLATQEKTLTGERLQFTHNDRLGARIITNPNDGTSIEQTTLPFGTALESESSGSINRRFTSYDRSASTGLDYALNRFYDSTQGRFTQVDPITLGATNPMNPQTLNLYGYTANDPVNRTDPKGLDWNDYNHPLLWMGWWGNIFTMGNGGGTSVQSGWQRFLQGLLGTFLGSIFGSSNRISYAINTIPASVFISNIDRFGLTDKKETKPIHPDRWLKFDYSFGNPNCITNAIANSRLTTNPNEMIVPRQFFDGTPSDPSKTDHDGVHILDPRGGKYNVTALRGMQGTVLHYGVQTVDPPFYSIVDIQLNIKLNGEPLVMTLKDMVWKKNGYRNGQTIKPGQLLGIAEGSFYSSGIVSEGGGLHITLYTLSTFNRYVRGGGFSSKARQSVPMNKLIDAYNDPRSPFKCP